MNMETTCLLRRQGVGTQMRSQGRAIPFYELQHAGFLGRGIGARRIGGAIYALLVVFNHLTVLVICCFPDLGQPLQIIIAPLDRILVDEPLGRDLGFGGANRGDAEDDGMIGKEVVPW